MKHVASTAANSDRRVTLSPVKVVGAYIEVLKPAASLLLTFLGAVAAIMAGGGSVSAGKLALIIVAVLVASAGANGLTNYLDRDVDGRMRRTQHRALPSHRISPAAKVLPLTLGLTAVGLVLAWFLEPVYGLAFAADVVGTLAAVIWRKKATCVFPQGLLAGCAPVLMAWFAVRPAFSWDLLFLCGLVGLWLPLHVWSLMIANHSDYVQAGITYFPMSHQPQQSVKVLPAFSVALAVIAVGFYFVGSFNPLYLVVAVVLSAMMVYGSFRLARHPSRKNAWRLYKLSSFPYLGIIFLAMALAVWLR